MAAETDRAKFRRLFRKIESLERQLLEQADISDPSGSADKQSPPAPAEVVLDRIHELYRKLEHIDRRSEKYKQLTEHIYELARAYGRLTDAQRGVGRPDRDH